MRILPSEGYVKAISQGKSYLNLIKPKPRVNKMSVFFDDSPDRVWVRRAPKCTPRERIRNRRRSASDAAAGQPRCRPWPSSGDGDAGGRRTVTADGRRLPRTGPCGRPRRTVQWRRWRTRSFPARPRRWPTVSRNRRALGRIPAGPWAGAATGAAYTAAWRPTVLRTRRTTTTWCCSLTSRRYSRRTTATAFRRR